MENGFFIVVEGIDGSGKTTLTKELALKIKNEGYSVILSREPTDGKFGSIIRSFKETKRPSPEEELDLFVKDREDHLENTIIPAIKSRHIVILDRYFYSTMAYQGALGIDMEKIRKRHDFALVPDLLVLLDIDVDTALDRVGSRSKADTYEGREYLEKVASNYKKINHPNLLSLDATKKTAYLVDDIWDRCLDMIRKIDEDRS